MALYLSLFEEAESFFKEGKIEKTVDFRNWMRIVDAMKTFLVVVLEPKTNKGARPHMVRGVVTSETAEHAIEVAKRHYPVGSTGWHPDAKFSAIEIQPGVFFMV